MIRVITVFASLLSGAQAAPASPVFEECLGRIRFQTPEKFSWATYDIENYKINSAGGHTFSKNVGAVGDYVRYDYSELLIKVSNMTTREEFDRTRSIVFHSVDFYKDHLKDRLETNKRLLATVKRLKYSANVIEDQANTIKELEEQIQKTKVYEFDLGIVDAYVLGSEKTPHEIFLWRNNRVFYFHMNKPGTDSAQRLKDLIARFEPRELYQVPEGPGVCMPYGFIHDDGNTGFSVKNSLRFTSTPNVIMSMINASPDDPTRPTRGTYNTDYSPGYDAEKWKKSKIMEKFFFGNRMTTLKGWRLDPRPESGEQERAWFAIAHVGGLVRPLLAVQMFTFQKGTDGLKDLTPPPEAVIPKFLKLTQSIREQ